MAQITPKEKAGCWVHPALNGPGDGRVPLEGGKWVVREEGQNALCFSFRAFTSSPSRRSAEIVEATDTMNITLMRAVSTVKIVNIGIPFLGSCVLAPQYWPSTAVRAEA
ncbi:hypothetical protein GCM10008012_57200 [Rhizobium anhuiense]|nr:hypothetical protein GCM10008012_57200 [Rhizobium anhuiense]